MPTSKEMVANRPLAGHELKQIILKDVEAVLDLDGMLAPHIAYGRVAYEVRVTLHMDNPAYPEHKSSLTSRERAHNLVATEPKLAAIEDGPKLYNPTDQSFLSVHERHRDIDSPNMARIENGLPVTVTRRTQDGVTREEEVLYPAEIVDGEVRPPIDTNLSGEARAAEGLPPEPATPPCDCGLKAKDDGSGYCGVCGGELHDGTV